MFDIVIKGLTRGERRRLLIEHAPREDDDLDAQVGYNADTFGDALIQACIVRTETLDGVTVENEWAVWADQTTNGQWEEVFRACLTLPTRAPPLSLGSAPSARRRLGPVLRLRRREALA